MFAQKIFAWARVKPDHPALIEDGVATGYGAFARMVAAAYTDLKRKDLPKGGFALAMGPTFLDQWVTTFALKALGLDTVSVANLAVARDLAIPNVSVIAGPAGPIREIENLEIAKRIRTVEVPDPMAALAHGGPLPEISESTPEGGAIVCTSGTTGTYKKLFYEGRHTADIISFALDSGGFDERTVLYGHNFPLWTGLGGAITTLWYAGGTAVMTRGRSFKEFFRHRPTKAMLVPAHLHELLAEVGETGAPHANLELTISGGFLPLSLAKRTVENITTNVNVAYGSTEVAGELRSRFQTADDLHWLTEHKAQYEIVDEEGQPCPTGLEGELRVKPRSFDCREYFGDPEATAKFFRDGYFYPGDLAVRREDRRIRVLGRVQDVINLNGYKTAVAPVEDAIQRRLDVNTVCLFTEFDDEGQTRVVVTVESERQFSQGDLAASVAAEPGFEKARFVVLKEFPRAQSGMRKVNRRELRKYLM